MSMTWITRGIEGEASYRSADYEQHRYEIERAARQNPYPFRDWFDGDNRIYVPLTDSSSSLSENDWEIINELESAGYVIDEESYIQGYVRNRSGNKVRIGKVLKRVLEESAKKEATAIEESTQKSIDEGFDENMATEEMGIRLNQSRAYHENMMRHFVNSPARSGSGDRLMVVISQDPHDIGKMSTDRGWTSCMDLDSGAYRQNVACEVAAGSLIAYVIRADDRMVEKPLARIHIKRYEDEEGNSYAVPEETVYGTEIEGFEQTVRKWLDERQGNLPMGFYRRKGGSYSDSLEESMFVMTDDEKKLTDIAINGVEAPEKFIIWKVIPQYEYERMDEEDMWLEDDSGPYLSFDTEEEAKQWIDSNPMSYDMSWRQNDWSYGEEWREEDEDGNYVLEPFEIEREVLKSEDEIREEAAQKIIEMKGMENVSDDIVLVRKDLLKYDSVRKSFNKKMYFGGKRHLLNEDEIQNLKASVDFGQSYANEISEMNDGPEKDGHVRELVSSAIGDIDWIITAPVEAATANYMQPSSYRAMDVFESALRSFSPRLFSVDRQIPQKAIEKMIEACRNAELIHEQLDDQVWSAKELREKMISSTLQTLGNAGTDTPIVIRWYESLLDEWEKEWERDKLDFSSINIHSMGRAIGALGPDNGQQFIPFMRERAKEAAKVYAAMPDTHIYKHKRQNMKNSRRYPQLNRHQPGQKNMLPTWA
jgi:hypothetical protein